MDKVTRWYDRNEDLKKIIDFLEYASNDLRINVAMDIIQFIIQENFASAKEITEFAQTNYTGNSTRWYDIDDTVHSALEMLKLLNDRELRIVINEMASSIVFFTQHQQKEKSKSNHSSHSSSP